MVDINYVIEEYKLLIERNRIEEKHKLYKILKMLGVEDKYLDEE